MANYRGLLWSLVAIAGTATAATVVYRYVTRPARPLDENESSSPAGDGNGTPSSSSRDRSGSATSAGDYEPLSGDEEDAESAELVGVDAVQRQEQQLALVTREGNMLLSVFGLIMIMLVGFVGVIVSWSTEGVATPWELPMFQPLLWLAIGVFTAASVEVLSQSGVTTAPEEIPVLSDKAVFPHDQQDFDMIARHNGANRPEERAAPRNEPRLPVVRTVHEADEEEEKQSAPPLSDVPSLVARADELFAQNKHSETHTLLKNAIVTYPTEIDLLWRLTRACTNLVDELTDPEQKKAMAFEGLGYADKAYELNPNVAATNKWKGIMTGTVGNFRDLKEKIAGAYVIRDSIQRAVELDPQDATCHNILGQWCLAFADMTWIEKRAAAALFGTPPTATYDEAVQHFANAERISPGFWKKNVFLLAQTYHKMKRDDDARAWLVKARDVPVKTKEDQDVAKDIDALMKKLKMGS